MFRDQLLAGRRILVTGGGTGLGKSMAARFLELGAEVHICGRRKIVCDETATELMDQYGGRVVSHGVDIRNAMAVDEMIEQIWTGGPLTDLVNNAAGNFISRTEELSPRGFDAVANIVMHGTFYVTHAVGRRWIANKLRGNVVSITVTWVRNGSPYVVPSAMSKSAIHAMTMSLATEWGRYGIRLNTIAPGEIPTEGMSKRIKPGDEAGARTKAMNPMGRVGTMEELQNLAVFLISGGCDWINGETIAMDGAQGLAMGGNFYQLRDWSDDDWTSGARVDQGAERKGPRGARVARHCGRAQHEADASGTISQKDRIASPLRCAALGTNKSFRENHVRAAEQPRRNRAHAGEEPRRCHRLRIRGTPDHLRAIRPQHQSRRQCAEGRRRQARRAHRLSRQEQRHLFRAAVRRDEGRRGDGAGELAARRTRDRLHRRGLQGAAAVRRARSS